jgi:hypothetical protein
MQPRKLEMSAYKFGGRVPADSTALVALAIALLPEEERAAKQMSVTENYNTDIPHS